MSKRKMNIAIATHKRVFVKEFLTQIYKFIDLNDPSIVHENCNIEEQTTSLYNEITMAGIGFENSSLKFYRCGNTKKK